jgi:dnd system-associated protein 4
MRLDITGIKRPKEFEETFQSYGNPQSGEKYESSPFISMKDFCMISAIYGYNNGVNVPFEKGEIIRISTFSETDIDIIKMIAIAHTKEIKVLEYSNRVAEIFEGYINGGVKFLINDLSNIESIYFDYMKMIIERF